MPYFNKNVGIEHGAGSLFQSLRPMIVMHQILGNSGSLSLPVTPHAHNRMVNVISPDCDINCGMDLYPCCLRPSKLLGIADIVNMAILNQRKYSSHTAYYSGLFTVVDIAAADNMMSNVFFQPAVILPAADGISFHLCRALHMPGCEIHVIFRIPVFAERNAAAAAVADLTVFNNPALAPVGPDHSVLIGSGRCPGCRCLCDFKTAYSNIIYSCFIRHKAVPTNSDLNLLLVGILSPEICIENSPVPFLF